MLKKQYVILNSIEIPSVWKQKEIRLEKTEGVFIECPHCGKLLRISEEAQNAKKG